MDVPVDLAPVPGTIVAVQVEDQSVPMPNPTVSEQTDMQSAEAALVVKWSEQAKIPDWLVELFERARDDQKFIHTTMLALDDDNRVAVPYLYRAIISKCALLRQDNPTPKVKRGDFVEPEPDDPRMGMWQQWCKHLARIARTSETILSLWSKEERLDGKIDLTALDGLTTSLVWVKTGMKTDTGRDRLGRHVRHGGAQDQVIRYRRMAREYEAGEWTAGDPRHRELLALADYLRAMARKPPMADDPRAEAIAASEAGQPIPSWLVPEPRVWRTGTADIVQMWDLRFDWARVVTVEDVNSGRWWQERVWMSRDEFLDRFKVTEEEANAIGTPWRYAASNAPNTGSNLRTGSETEDPEDIDIEAYQRHNGREVAVWERTDLELGIVAWWTQGIPRILDQEIMDATTKRGHPYIPFMPSPVSGRMVGLSDVTLAKKEQLALNQALTDDFEARVAAYPFYAVMAGLLTPEDIKKIKERTPNEVVELSQQVTTIKDNLQKFPGEPYNSQLYIPAALQAQRNIELAIGMPTEAMQGTNRGTQFATQAAIQADNMSAQMGRISAMLSGVRRQVLEDWQDYALATLSADEANDYAGPFAEWPVWERDRISRFLQVEVVATANRSNRAGDLDDLKAALEALDALLRARAAALQQGLNLSLDQLIAKVGAAADLRIAGPLLSALDPRTLAAASGGGMPGGMPGAQPVPGPQPVPGAA